MGVGVPMVAARGKMMTTEHVNERRTTRARASSVFTALALTAVIAACGTGKQDGATASGSPANTGTAAPATSAPMDHDKAPMDHGNGATASGTPIGAEHDHGAAAYVALDSETQKKFSAEMARVREITMQYPTVADATAAGFHRVGPFAPGSAAHYLVPQSQMMSSLGFTLDHPIIWLFAGNEPTSPVVGVMYYAMGADPPEGFAGPNDHWHKHTGLCLASGTGGDIDIALPVDQDATREQCDAVKGRLMATTGWMVHVWSAPGWESPVGVFAHDNPIIQCTDGKTPAEATLNVGCRGLA